MENLKKVLKYHMALGVDFGTTHSCVSYYNESGYHLIPNENGKYITKSCIYFNPCFDEILYGDIAYQYQTKDKSSLFNLKRLLGVTYKDFVVNETLCYCFKHLHIVPDINDQYCEIVLTFNNKLQKF